MPRKARTLLALSLSALLLCLAALWALRRPSSVRVPQLTQLTEDAARARARSSRMPLQVDARLFSPAVPAGRVLTQTPLPDVRVPVSSVLHIDVSLGPQPNPVPRVVGEPERNAAAELLRRGWQLGAVAHIGMAGIAPGMVLAQTPEGNALGVLGPQVGLLVSAPVPVRPFGFVMPNFVGKPIRAASAAIAHRGLKLGKLQYIAARLSPRTVPHPPHGQVLAQAPPAGAEVNATTPIRLTVSR